MMTNDEIARHMEQLELPLETKKEIQKIRESEPSRRTRSSKKNVNCRYPSKKMNGVIQAESRTLELSAVLLWEYDNEVFEFYDQPPQIKVSVKKRDGKNGAYFITPDFFLISKSFIGWVECKTVQTLEAEVDKGKRVYAKVGDEWQHLPGNEYASVRGLGYLVLTDMTFEKMPKRIDNLNFLADYLSEEAPKVSPAEIRRIRKYLPGGKALVADVLDEIKKNADRHTGADAFYKMIADGQLHFDIDHDDITSEPALDHTYVFASAEHLKAHQILANHSATESSETVQVAAVSLVESTEIIWDQKVYRIRLADSNEIFLEAVDDGEQKVVKRSVAEILVQKGEITGHVTAIASMDEQFQKFMQSQKPKEIEKAWMRLKAIKEGDKSVPETTLRFWKRCAERGRKEFGNAIAGLVLPDSSRGNRNARFPLEVYKLMEEFNQEMLSLRKDPLRLYGVFAQRCSAANLPQPSQKTYGKYLRKLTGEHERILKTQGEKAAYATQEICWNLQSSSPPHGSRPWEVVHIDHTELDVQLIDSRTNEAIGRPWLTVMIDAYTRLVLAYVISMDKPNKYILMLLMRECIRRNGRVPDRVVVDQGPEFQSIFWEILLLRLGIIKLERPTAQSHFGSIVERNFGTTNTAFIHFLQGSTEHMKDPRGVSKEFNPVNTAVWTFGRLNAKLAEYFYKSYASTPYPALGTTPSLFYKRSMETKGLRAFKGVCLEHVEVDLLPELVRTYKLIPGKGLAVHRNNYSSEALRGHRKGTAFRVRFDPYNIGYIMAEIDGQWQRCECGMAASLREKSVEEVMMISVEFLAKNSRYEQLAAEAGMSRGRFIQSLLDEEKMLNEEMAKSVKESADMSTNSSGSKRERTAQMKTALVPPVVTSKLESYFVEELKK